MQQDVQALMIIAMFSLNIVKVSTVNITIYLPRAAAAAGRAEISETTIIGSGHNRFTAPFWGGFDGFDITKPDPL